MTTKLTAKQIREEKDFLIEKVLVKLLRNFEIFLDNNPNYKLGEVLIFTDYIINKSIKKIKKIEKYMKKQITNEQYNKLYDDIEKKYSYK